MPNESGEREGVREDEGQGQEEIGRSGYYHGTPLFPPPPPPIPWGDERSVRVRGKVKGMFNA